MKNTFNLLQNGFTLCTQSWGKINEIAVFYRIYYVYGGEAYLKHDGVRQRMKKGYMYIMPLMQPYSLSHNTEDPFEVLWFHIEMPSGFYNEFIEIKIQEETILYSLLESLRMMTDRPAYYDDFVQLFDVFLTMLNGHKPFQSIQNHSMNGVTEYIEEHIGKNLNVQMIADFVGMERSYFSRKFKKTFNMSPNQYIIAKRMKVAAIALINGASVYQASIASGYEDEKSFSRAFSKYMEVPPSVYRKSHVIEP